ncbi:Aste57867_17665 [Aphanomyces stellatus]|uniref:Aste57867_17665 protein n=1 Tax=Aphanomyces stellatus TaxID=120398 RepID=A0A485L8A4_9STRA|nr:hypothetical protein As57867_017604 [Aphanomyces stellatus]VFT94416.1 Aste57867_17665 [Aphanomyces stellatus]
MLTTCLLSLAACAASQDSASSDRRLENTTAQVKGSATSTVVAAPPPPIAQAQGTAVAGNAASMAPAGKVGGGITTLDYADGYGTTLHCTNVCHFITISFAVAMALFLLLLIVIPVSTTKYVKSSTRKRTLKRPLDHAASGGGSAHVTTTTPYALPRDVIDPYHVDDETKAGSDDDDADSLSTASSRYDFISSLSDAQHQPLLKASRTAKSTSPRRHRHSAHAIDAPSGAVAVTATIDEVVKRAALTKKSERRQDLRAADTSYENLRDDEIQEHEYLEFVRTLLEGLVLKRIKPKNGHGVKIAKWRFSIAHDLTRLQWSKAEGLQVLKKTESVLVRDIVGITTGMLDDASGAGAGTGGLFLSLLQVDHSSLDLLAENEAMHQKLYNGFSMLLREHHQEKPAQT